MVLKWIKSLWSWWRRSAQRQHDEHVARLLIDLILAKAKVAPGRAQILIEAGPPDHRRVVQVLVDHKLAVWLNDSTALTIVDPAIEFNCVRSGGYRMWQ